MILDSDWHGENPLLDAWCKAQDAHDRFQSRFASRDLMVAMFAWAVPNEAALKLVAKFSPLVEIGAGTGYWAHLLTERGADVIAYDNAPPATHKNNWHGQRECFFPVRFGTDVSIVGNDDRTLFLCWPPYDDPMGANCLRLYRGNRLVYVGEGSGGCCGDDEFWDLIERNWREVESLGIPQWYGLHDALTVYERQGKHV